MFDDEKLLNQIPKPNTKGKITCLKENYFQKTKKLEQN